MSHPIAHDDEFLTLEEYLALPESEYRLELSRGRAGAGAAPVTRHGRIEVRLVIALGAYENASAAGITVTNTGFILPLADTGRVPDVAFIRQEQIPAEGYPAGVWRIAPDLVIEILSPSNRPHDIHEKVVDDLEAGVQLIWIIDPDARTATVHRHRHDPLILREGDTLEDGELLPGLAIRLDGLFLP